MSKTILITGASTGFGRASAELLATAGHRVFATMRDPTAKNREHANALWARGIDVVALDVTSDTSVDQAVRTVRDKAGGIDVLINNAGIASAGITEAFTPAQVTALFDTNVVGLLRTARAVLPSMRKAGDGLIINVGSILGRVTIPFFGIYGATKMAVEALTDSLRVEVAPFGVDVVLVQPSAHPTSMYDTAKMPEDPDRIAGYGSVADAPGMLFRTFMTMFNGENAPNVGDVPAAIAHLIELPKEARPARTVVGAPFGSDKINAFVRPIQDQVVNDLGLAQLSMACAAT